MKDDAAHARIDALEGRMLTIEARIGEPSSRFPVRPATGVYAPLERLLEIEEEKKRERDAEGKADGKRAARISTVLAGAKAAPGATFALGILVAITAGVWRLILLAKGVTP